MQITSQHPGDSRERHIFSGDTASAVEGAVVKAHCWYCNKPLYTHRTYCSAECREAIYEDNDRAKERRMIFGCQC